MQALNLLITLGLIMRCSHSNCKSMMVLEDKVGLPAKLVNIE